MSSSMQLELRERIYACHYKINDLHGVILHGDHQHGAFCAGADLSEVQALANYVKIV